MRKRINAKSSEFSFFKFVFRMLSWFLILAIVTVIIFMLLGYYEASKPVSYLPEIKSNALKTFSYEGNQVKLESQWYKLLVDANGNVNIKTPEGEDIISNLIYYDSYSDVDENWGLDNVSVQLTSDSTISILGKGSSDVLVNIKLTVPKSLPKLDVNVRTHYNLNTVVKREALVALFNVQASEIYLKNRQKDADSIDTEYWMDKQGARFGTGQRSALIYHTPFVSSLQYNSKENLLFINLEYFLDHPNINIPYQEDSGGRWKDISAANYSIGAERNNSFSIYFGNLPHVTPRIMLVPDGYLAGYVFTEHADGGDMRINRAVYFGSENISRIENAIGGFAGHRIPVTKSVFYVGTKDCSVSVNPQFLDFLDQLYATGLYDICLHTPEDLSSNRQLLEKSISFMKERYDTKTWIDHGMYGGKINRECFVCDGLNSSSEYYAADFWSKYNTCYFWNAGPEKIRDIPLKKEINGLRIKYLSVELWRRYLSRKELEESTLFGAFIKLIANPSSKYELNSLKPHKGNSYPTPLYWQNITQTGQFYSWVTDYVKDFSNLSGNKAVDYYDNEQKLLEKLLNDRGVFINHGYFIRNRPDKEDGTFTENDMEIKVNPYFDKILEFMAHLRDEGDLCITTVRDLLDYWILVENISFEYRPDGTIYIYNGNKKDVKGLSLIVSSDKVRINGEIPKFKREGDNTIFWFDIPAGARMVLKVE